MIPETVKIGWRTYQIEQGERREGENAKYVGEIDYAAKKIYLYHGVPEDEKYNNLLHEILHGIFFLTARGDLRSDEDLINALAEHLQQVILDNPGLFLAAREG